jgi:hypothetical protein
MLGAMPVSNRETKQRYATIKGRSRGICHGKIEEQQAILGKQKWLGSVFVRCGQT